MDGTHPAGAGRPRLASILAAAVLSAALASASTAALVTTLVARDEAGGAGGSPGAVTASTSQTTEIQDITEMVAAARESVVTITVEVGLTRGPFGGTATGVGSGVILTSDGYILTNRHVVEGATSVSVALSDGTEHEGTVVDVADSTDLALVRIVATGLRAAPIGDSDAIEVGQTAIAIGSPLGEYTETVTKGIVSALDREITVRDEQSGRPVTLSGLIQTDAAINEGNSGGPLLDAAGRVVGINTAVASSAEGLGFAIPISAAADLIELAESHAA